MRPGQCYQFQSTRPRGARRRVSGAAVSRPLISIHAPTRGATLANVTASGVSATFQSTRPRGARLGKVTSAAVIDFISIHAPTRGATRQGPFGRFPRFHFNPRAHAGRDLTSSKKQPYQYVFQSTRPRGARPDLRSIYGDGIIISIHAPTRGATCRWVMKPGSSTIFQSTRPRGARRVRLTRWLCDLSFQSTRPRGARPRPPQKC